MEQIKDGGPAFPDPGRAQSAKQREILTQTGISVRDYFAAKAIQGLISGLLADGSALKDEAIPAISTRAYEFADAMLAAREKQP